ncbi:hypothetical protein [Kaarinaea lacus]
MSRISVVELLFLSFVFLAVYSQSSSAADVVSCLACPQQNTISE